MSFVLVSVITFADGEESISQPYARGSLEECRRVMAMIPAVATANPKHITSAELTIVAADEYDALGDDEPPEERPRDDFKRGDKVRHSGGEDDGLMIVERTFTVLGEGLYVKVTAERDGRTYHRTYHADELARVPEKCS